MALGGNLPSAQQGLPLATCTAALDRLELLGITIVQCSSWYRSLPLPASSQPPFVNGVVRIATTLDPVQLLDVLHFVEAHFGRRRDARNAPRTLDLDLLAYGNTISGPQGHVRLPHPRMHQRAFVLKPLAELAPRWRHPVLGLTVVELLSKVSRDQSVELIEGGRRIRLRKGGDHLP